ncbi:hypothetical protein [Aestuariivivens sediminicola]|uniref:hypothetical protein n=1 Tax=Aestuariivivens sediminicola TaxID=2913560 RepID=UPI001F56C743|nr:hypothetical protein [Aestuariivivens sediminicola]
MSELLSEFKFWIIFLVLNYLNYLVVYILHYRKSRFLPYIRNLKNKKIGLIAEGNLDFFRYSVEISFIIIISRFFDLHNFSIPLLILYFIFLIFNFYQYSFRKIYETEPIIFNDLKLIKNGMAIIWHESKFKVLVGIIISIWFLFFLNKLLKVYLISNYEMPLSQSFILISFGKFLLVVYSVYKFKKGYRDYPNDIYLRYHFTSIELFVNLVKSFDCYKLSKLKFGNNYKIARENIDIELNDIAPNIHFIFVESYGSLFYNEKKLQIQAYKTLRDFKRKIKDKGFGAISNFSESTTTGGQSWLTYTSVLFGYRIDNNTLFENLLNDPHFCNSNGFMQLFKKMGYTNYNLNPINPINGITVPYEAMRKMYSIDRWILNKDIQYTGDKYGFGAAAPDQYSMNFTMDIIKKENKKPYTFFYLTKSSHSPFPKVELVDDWRTLNHTNGSIHEHKGFLKYPSLDDYAQAINYQIMNLQRFISDSDNNDDIFIVFGDHQPPILSNPSSDGLKTPVHIISKNHKFLNEFKAFNFVEELSNATKSIKHEAFYSIFLRAFCKNYAKSYANIPKYEPDGLQF